MLTFYKVNGLFEGWLSEEFPEMRTHLPPALQICRSEDGKAVFFVILVILQLTQK